MTASNNSSGDDRVKLHGGVAKKVTDKAILFHTTIYPGETIEVWWPRSEVSIDPDDSCLWVPRWLLEKKEEELNEMIMLDKQFL